MNNYISLIMAIFVHTGIMTKDEAEKLTKELHFTTLPDNFDSAYRVVENIFQKHKIKKFDKSSK